MKAIRERIEDLWIRLQLDYEARQYALYVGLFVLSYLPTVFRKISMRRRRSAIASEPKIDWEARRRDDEERMARLIGRAVAESLEERSPR